jgi:hypothetical protein
MAQEEKSGSRDLETLKARESGLTDRAKIEQDAKTAESEGLKAQQELAMQKIKEASELWSKNKEDQGLQTMLTNAVNDAKTVRLSIPNPIETWIRDKASTQGADQRQQSIELQKSGQEFNQEMQRENSKRDNEKLALEKAKFAKEAKAESEKLKGSALDSTSIAQLSNLKTVLTSIAEIKNAFEKFQNASSVGEKYEAIRDLKGSALLGSENLGRVQSGGAIQAEELATFKTLMSPSTLDFVDGGASYLNNVAKLEASINGKIGNFATKGRSLTGGTVQSVPVVAPSKTGKMRMIK